MLKFQAVAEKTAKKL